MLRRAPPAAAGSSSPPPPPLTIVEGSAIASLLRFLPLPPPAAGPLRDEAVEAKLWIELAGEARFGPSPSSSARKFPPPEEAVGVSAGEVTSYAGCCWWGSVPSPYKDGSIMAAAEVEVEVGVGADEMEDAAPDRAGSRALFARSSE